MLIGDKYKISSDSLNIILSEKYQKGDEEEDDEEEIKEGWKTLGFFSTIPNALQYMVNHEIRGTGMEDLKTINSKIAELYLLIMSLNLSR